FENANRGIAVGAYGAFYETRDGGRTWTGRKFEYRPLPRPRKPASADEFFADQPPDYHLNKIAGIGSRLYIAAEAGNLFRSDDGGATWRQLPSPYNGSFYGVLPLTPDDVLVFGLRGRLFRSGDGGATWQAIPTGTEAMLTDGYRDTDGTLVIVGLAGTVLVSRDGGTSWIAQQQADRKGLAAVVAAGDGHIVVVGEGGVKRLSLHGTSN
ncbi:MAG: YCF48-related protein, partial [Steroidobacteraceae bacterium]|nr:YCF48-related protein [Steroidobacteraceae bacterium]MDW8259407.1 YCF48-related protein [Gammaproteobacteria bacterium]